VLKVTINPGLVGEEFCDLRTGRSPIEWACNINWVCSESGIWQNTVRNFHFLERYSTDPM